MADKVLDFIGKRKENIEKKRRNFERILFQNFLGAYSLVKKGEAIYPVTLVDISHDGCLFQIPWDVKRDEKFEKETELTLRMYFTKGSYVPVVVNIKYGNEYIDDDGQTYIQYGCEFDKSMPSFQAMEKFIEFLYKFAEHSSVDHGDHKVFYL